MDTAYIRERITALRLKKDVSEYKMSLDLGHSKSYVQSITSGRALPSWPEFFSICEYFGVTPRDVFDDQAVHPELLGRAIAGCKNLDESDLRLVVNQIERLLKK